MARTYRELVAWQLAEELRQGIVAGTATSAALADRDYCNQVRDAAASVPANVAEGFAYTSPADFARFLGYAAGSLAELDTRLRDGFDRGYLTAEHVARLLQLRARCERAVRNLRADRLRTAHAARRRR